MEYIREIFPVELQKTVEDEIRNYKAIREIRIRVNCPVFLRTETGDYHLSIVTDKKDLEAIIIHLSKSSRFACEEEWKQGFMTLPHGHRVGIGGQVVLDGNGNLKTIKYIRFMHIRIAHEVKGSAKKIIDTLGKAELLPNVLIISPPGYGKTTLLRDFIRQLSDGTKDIRYKQCVLIDERDEIAAPYQGVPQMDLGAHTDVLSDCPKFIGMMMAIRSLGPEVVALDELGNEKDIEALNFAIKNGCTILATIHGRNIDDVRNKNFIRPLIETKSFQRYVIIRNEKHEYDIYDENLLEC